MVDDRKLDVLRAIVEDYVATEEPVGSKALVERHGLGVSPATVRNDMAALEEEGYIHQPHTSAGRVPDRQGLPALRRQARHPQADEHGRAPRDLHAARRRRRPRRRGAEVGAAAEPADPPGRDRAVPHALALDGAPRRAGRAHPDPGDGDPDPQHRPGRAAPRRARRPSSATTDLAELRVAVNRRQRGRADRGRRGAPLVALPDAVRPEQADSTRARSRRSWPRPCPTTAATSASR